MKKTIQIALVFSFLSSISISINLPTPPPPGPIGPYLNGVFPSSAPGGTWDLEDALPNFTFNGPLRVLPFPNSSDVLILCKVGELWRVSIEDQTRELVLDITDRSFKRGEGGTVGMALHPKFGDSNAPDKQQLFVFYRTKPDPDVYKEYGFNRLSKFTWDESNQSFDPDSEEVLIQQYDRKTWHNGGGMFFGPDNFLYLSLGDEGADDHISVSTQRLDGGFFSGVIRIDVDNDPLKSHPIRRQPIANSSIPWGWGENYSQGYSIPNDNPWLDEDGKILEEFYAIGIRSPYSFSLDQETEQMWLCDVGSDKFEEINIIERGDNLQWPFMEGTHESEEHSKPDTLIGNEKTAFFEYNKQNLGSCVIGGEIYRGTVFPELNGKFLFGDWQTNKLMALTNTSLGSETEAEILISNIANLPESLQIPEKPGITGIFPQGDGEILITVMGEDPYSPGKIYNLKREADVPEPPAKLSQLGAFSDLETLTPVEGVIPYTVNSPLWSDRAIKKRWMALPNNGQFDSEEEQIVFDGYKEWTFPEGTVFIKHFELPLTTNGQGDYARLETRFFIVGENGQSYGVTYLWNEEETDAILLGGGVQKEFDIYENGNIAFSQKWDFPSRDQCTTCHNANAKYILGVNTHQLNGDFHYSNSAQTINQLTYLNQQNIFHRNIGDPNNYPKSYPIDDESVDLDLRILSYFDSNCSSCHRIGGANMVSLNLKYGVPLRLQNSINVPTQSQASNQDNLIIEPGFHQLSEIWIRDASLEENKMPPLAKNLVDEVYIDALAEWIDQLSSEEGFIEDHILFPNPTDSWLNIRIKDESIAPYQIRIYSITGILFLETTTEQKSFRLDIDWLEEGTYILEVKDENNRTVQKFIKGN